MRCVWVVAVATACGSGAQPRPQPSPPTPTALAIEPADAVLTVTDGAPATQSYQAILQLSNGDTQDVTADATFTVDAPRIASFQGADLHSDGSYPGRTTIHASADGLTADTTASVKIVDTILVHNAPANAPSFFASLPSVPNSAFTIAYPADGAVAPPNMGDFDVTWNANCSLCELHLENEFVDIRVYTKDGKDLPGGQVDWDAIPAAAWTLAAHSGLPLQLTVSIWIANVPMTVYVMPPQHVIPTNDDARGVAYFLSMALSSQPVLYRFDFGTQITERVLSDSQTPGGAGTCVGCHAISRDGRKLAINAELTSTPQVRAGTTIDLATDAIQIPVTPNTSAQQWDYATLTPTGDKMVTVTSGVMSLRAVSDGSILATLPNNSGVLATEPDLSPDGRWLVNVETTSLPGDAVPADCAVVVRSFDPATNTFGAITTVLPIGADGLSSCHPSFSPDGQWIAVARAAGGENGYHNFGLWVVKADGSQPPVELHTANLAPGYIAPQGNSYPRWLPFTTSLGAGQEPAFYLSFHSERLGLWGATPQLYMTPFFPMRALAATDPSGPAIHLPFQLFGNQNLTAAWTAAIP
jgi:hypothetical protein